MKPQGYYTITLKILTTCAVLTLSFIAVSLAPKSLNAWNEQGAWSRAVSSSPSEPIPTVTVQPEEGASRTAWVGLTDTLKTWRFWDAPSQSTTVMFLHDQQILQQTVIPRPDDTVHLIVQLRDDPVAVYVNRTFKQPGRLTASEQGAVQTYAAQLAATRQQVLSQMSQQGIQVQVKHEFGYLFNGLALSAKMRDWQRLKQLPQVKAVEPDYQMQADLSDSVPLIGAPSVWAMTDAGGHAVTGRGVRVAIVDTGVDYAHPDLGGGLGSAYKVVGGYDFVNNDPDPMDDNGHGTHVAGIVAANGVLKGVAPDASLLAYKVLNDSGWGQTSAIIAGLERAADPDDNPATDDGANVINMSLGGGGNPDSPLSQAVDNAVNHGIVVVVAAGNSGPSAETIGCPGVARNALTVAASDKYDTLAEFSSRGPVPGYADVIKPDITAPGVSIQSTVPLYGSLGSPTRYRSLDGTSMATPHVAGAVALIKQLHPDWTPEVIKANLMNTAKNLGRDMFEQGAGRVDVYAAARAPATISPGSLAMGWDDLDQPVWSTTKTLTITNRSTSMSAYSLTLAAALPQGITVTFSPANMSLLSGESQPILVSLTVDNHIVPDSNSPSHSYEGQVIVQSGSNAWKIPFAFVKMPLLNVTFDEGPAVVGVHNGADKWWFPSNSGLSMPMYVPPGTYDIMVAYGDLATWVVKERIPVTAKTDVIILKSEAANEVQLKLLDVNSHEIPPAGWFPSPIGFSALKHKASGVTIAFGGAAFNFQPDPSHLHFSDISSAYRYEARIPAQSVVTNWDYYDFSYLLANGITTSMIVQNDPRQFKKIEYQYKSDPSTQQLWRVWWWNTEGMGISVSPSAVRQLVAPFKERGYYVPASPDAVWKWGYSQVFTVYPNLNEGDPSYVPPLYQTPFLHARDPQTMDLYLDTRLPANLSVTSDYLPVGSAPPHWRGKFENRDDALIVNVPQVGWGLLVLNQALDRTSYGNLPYELYQSGRQVGSGTITRSPISLGTPGAYTMTVPYTHYYVKDRPGTARATIGFDTSSTLDKNPPYLLSLNVLAGDRMVESLAPSDAGEIRFSVGDDTGLDQVTLAYQAGGAWQELALHQSGNVFTATVPTVLSDSYVALKITAHDTQGNWLSYEANPAFYVVAPLAGLTISGPTAGMLNQGYNFTANVTPLTATQPILYVWQATGKTSVTNTAGLTNTMSFAWDTAGDKVITVTASNEVTTVTQVHAITIYTNSHNVGFVGQIGGPTYAVATLGSAAYIGVGPRLVVLNVADPAHPAFSGETRPFPSVVKGVAVSGTFAYVAAGESGGLRIVNVSDPAHPLEVGSFVPGHAIESIALAGNYAYTVGGDLHVINIADPAHPVKVNPDPVLFSAAYGIAVMGNHAFVAQGTDGLAIFDISDPAHPVQVGFTSTPHLALNVAAAGNYAYVADGQSGGLQVFDVSDPVHPLKVGAYVTPGGASGVAVVGNAAYIADMYGGLRVINITDPAHPAETGFYVTPGLAWNVAVMGQYAYVAAVDQGLHIVNIVDSAHPAEAGAFAPPGYAENVAVAGNTAYVLHGRRLYIVNALDPAHLSMAGTFDTSAHALDVAVSGNYAYVADDSDGLRIINIADPAHPFQVGGYVTPGQARGVAVAGDYAYIADGPRGLRILRVSTPQNPTSVGAYDTPGYAYDVAVSGGYVYVADGETSGLHIFNVSDPVHPQHVGVYDKLTCATGVAVTGNTAYVADCSSLRIINVSDPAHPTEVGSAPRTIRDVAVMGNYAFTADDGVGMGVVDVSNPAQPTEDGFYRTLDSAERITADENYVYVADGNGGLLVLRYPVLPLKADFAGAPTNGRSPLDVTFTNQSTGDYASSLWHFGDGVTSTLRNPAHTYSKAGTFTVTLTVSGPDGSDTLTRTSYIHTYLPQPILVAPVCGTTNNIHPVAFGLAPTGFTIALYDNGAQQLTTTITASNTFALVPTLASGQHILTAMALSGAESGLSSRPLTLTVNPALIYDPVGVTFAYDAPWGQAPQHPHDSSGCANPDDWRVWLRSGYTTTVTVPVSYTASAAVTLTLGAQTVLLAEGVGHVFAGVLTPPIVGGTFVITITTDGQTDIASGSVLIDPDGYVFDKNEWESQGVTQRLASVAVTCEYSDTIEGEWKTWEAWAYDEQVNPQVTGADGYYAFFVPPGTYRIMAQRPSYLPFTSSDIVVVDAPADLNIPLLQWWQVYLPVVLSGTR